MVLVSFRSLSLPTMVITILLSFLIKVPSLVSTPAMHLIILYGAASILIQYKPRMLHRLSHLVTHPRAAAKRGPLQSLLSFSSSCLREALDRVFSFRSLWRLQ